MDVVRLPPGEEAPADSDSICMNRLPDGRCNLTGTVLLGDESVSIVGEDTYASKEEAETAGLAWADAHGVKHLYIVVTGH